MSGVSGGQDRFFVGRAFFRGVNRVSNSWPRTLSRKNAWRSARSVEEQASASRCRPGVLPQEEDIVLPHRHGRPLRGDGLRQAGGLSRRQCADTQFAAVRELELDVVAGADLRQRAEEGDFAVGDQMAVDPDDLVADDEAGRGRGTVGSDALGGRGDHRRVAGGVDAGDREAEVAAESEGRCGVADERDHELAVVVVPQECVATLVMTPAHLGGIGAR